MVKFKVVKYIGESNGITRFGYEYLALPYFLDSDKMTIYAERNGNLSGIEYGVCNEYKYDLKEVGELEVENMTVSRGVLKTIHQKVEQ